MLSPCGGNYSFRLPSAPTGRTLVLQTPVRLDRSFRWSRFFTLCYQRQTLARTTRSHHSYFIVWAQTRHWLGYRGLCYIIIKHITACGLSTRILGSAMRFIMKTSVVSPDRTTFPNVKKSTYYYCDLHNIFMTLPTLPIPYFLNKIRRRGCWSS